MGTVRKILVTGATGYLGRNLLTPLLKEGNEIGILIRDRSDLSLIENLEGKIVYFNIDKLQLETIITAFAPDIIIHTAASYGRNGESLSRIIQSNLYFPIELLDLAIKNKVKYFINTDTSLPKDLNAYSRSKKQFLEWLEYCSKDINVLNIELEYFYGPHDSNSKFITYVLQELYSNRTSIDFTEALSLRDFIYIEDVVTAFILLISEIDSIAGFKKVSLGSGKAVMLKELIIMLRELSGNTAIKLNFGAIPTRANEIMYSCADLGFLNALGWQPKYSLEQGILKMIDIEKNAYDTN